MDFTSAVEQELPDFIVGTLSFHLPDTYKANLTLLEGKIVFCLQGGLEWVVKWIVMGSTKEVA